MNDPRLPIDLGYPDPPPPADLAQRARRKARAIRNRRRAAAGAGSALAVIAVAGLTLTLHRGSSDDDPSRVLNTGSTGSPSPAPDRTPQHTPGHQPTRKAGNPPASPPTGSSSSGTARARCTVADLEVSLGRSDGAAGHVYHELLFVNTSSRPCTLDGAPGVSFLDAAGGQLGLPALRDTNGHPIVPVVLTPGAPAHSVLTVTDTGVYGPAGSAPCKSARSARIRVYPPGSFDSVQLPATLTICTTTTGRTQITPVTRGHMP